MKKVKYLIPVLFLFSCASTGEVYDDVYRKAEKPVKEEVNEDLGYADYIKGNEEGYEVETVDVDSENKNKFGGGYATENGDLNVYNFEHGYVSNRNYLGWNDPIIYGSNWACRYRCHQFHYYGRCCHQLNTWNDFYGCNGFGFYGGLPSNYGYYGYSYNPWNGWNNPWNAPFYGNSYYNGFYNGYYNGYNNGFFSGTNNGFIGGGNPTDDLSSNNHHYGHRNGISTGSSNTTTYPNTVKAPVTDQPFSNYVGDAPTVTFDNNTVMQENSSEEKVDFSTGNNSDISNQTIKHDVFTQPVSGGIFTEDVKTIRKDNAPKSNGFKPVVGTSGVVSENTRTNRLNNSDKVVTKPASNPFKSVVSAESNFRQNSTINNSTIADSPKYPVSQNNTSTRNYSSRTTQNNTTTTQSGNYDAGSSTVRTTSTSRSNSNRSTYNSTTRVNSSRGSSGSYNGNRSSGSSRSSSGSRSGSGSGSSSSSSSRRR